MHVDIWSDETVLSVARTIHKEQNLDDCPILADVLEERCLASAEVLNALRTEGDIVRQKIVCLGMGGNEREAVRAIEALLDDFEGDFWDMHDVRYDNTKVTYEQIMEVAHAKAEGKFETITEWGDGWHEIFRNRADAFWDHYETITGKTVEDRDDYFFSCSC